MTKNEMNAEEGENNIELVLPKLAIHPTEIMISRSGSEVNTQRDDLDRCCILERHAHGCHPGCIPLSGPRKRRNSAFSGQNSDLPYAVATTSCFWKVEVTTSEV
jgi:hypothetical protein